MKHIFILLLVFSTLFMVSCLTTPAGLYYPDFDEGIQALSRQLKQQYSSLPGSQRRRIVVLPFMNQNGGISSLGRRISNAMQVRLFDNRMFSFIERERIDAILSEYELGASGLIAQETMQQIGNILSAEIAVTGTITPEESNSQDSFAVYGRIVDISTGEVYASGYIRLPYSRELRSDYMLAF